MQWVPGALSSGLKRPGRGGEHLSPYGAEVKNGVIMPPHTIRLHGLGLNELIIGTNLLLPPYIFISLSYIR
jgi:hypothetical protein